DLIVSLRSGGRLCLRDDRQRLHLRELAHSLPGAGAGRQKYLGHEGYFGGRERREGAPTDMLHHVFVSFLRPHPSSAAKERMLNHQTSSKGAKATPPDLKTVRAVESGSN